MAEVVELRPDHVAAAHAEHVRFVCGLVYRTDLADDFIRRGLTFQAVIDELCIATGRHDPGSRRMRRLLGRAGNCRRTLPKFFGRYGR